MAGRDLIFVRLLGVIAIWFFALQVWDIATLQALRVIRSIGGLARFAAGCAIGLGALVLLYATIPDAESATFSMLAIGTFVAALAAEFLVGDDLRGLLRGTGRRP